MQLQVSINLCSSKMLTVVVKSGLYRYLRLPFGPMPGSAAMQSYVNETFTPLVSNATGNKFVFCVADDFKISSPTAEAHRSDCRQLPIHAESKGSEFKATKCQWDRREVTLWAL